MTISYTKNRSKAIREETRKAIPHEGQVLIIGVLMMLRELTHSKTLKKLNSLQNHMGISFHMLRILTKGSKGNLKYELTFIETITKIEYL